MQDIPFRALEVFFESYPIIRDELKAAIGNGDLDTIEAVKGKMIAILENPDTLEKFEAALEGRRVDH